MWYISLGKAFISKLLGSQKISQKTSKTKLRDTQKETQEEIDHQIIEDFSQSNFWYLALVYRGWYIFTGGINQAGWLFTKLVTNGVKVLIAGLFALPVGYKTTRCAILQSYGSNVVPDPVKAKKVIRSPWKYGAHKHHMLLRGTQDTGATVLFISKVRIGTGKLADRTHYNPLVAAGCSPSEPDQVASEGYVERPWPEARRLIYRESDWSKSLTLGEDRVCKIVPRGFPL
jgi:hypothetical protein